RHQVRSELLQLRAPELAGQMHSRARRRRSEIRVRCGARCVNTCGPAQECINSGPGAQCAKSHCTSASTGIGAATCIALGAPCPTDQAVAFDCGAYACEPALGTCLTSCSSSSDCAGAFVCDTDRKTCAAP